MRDRPFIVHVPKVGDQVVSPSVEPAWVPGQGTGWPCAHDRDQVGGKRCVRCCAASPAHYVLRNAAGGDSPMFTTVEVA